MKSKKIILVTFVLIIIAFGLSTPGFANEDTPSSPKPVAYPWVVRPDLFEIPVAEEEEGLFEPRIVGGSSYTPENKYPWIASLQFPLGNHYCGGTLIASDWVLTSAHCWMSDKGYLFDPSPDDWVVLGEYDFSDPLGTEQYIGVDEVYIHPDYNWFTFEYDIALLKLSSPATLNSDVQTIPIVNTSPSNNTPSIITGWGVHEYQEKDPDTGVPILFHDLVHEANIFVLPNSSCSNYGSFYKSTSMLCGGVPDYSVDACQGDSGGALFFDDGGQMKVAGVTSWGNGCAKTGFPGVYARVSSAIDWIDWIQTNYGTPSSHDDISNAKVIPSHPYQDFEEYTAFDTSDANDPEVPMCDLNKGKGTVWYTYTPASNQSFFVETLGSNFDTFIAVWTGSPGSLVSVACNDDFNGTLQSKISVDLIGGTTYYIEVGQYVLPLVGEPTKPPAHSGGTLLFSTSTFYDVPGSHTFYPYIEAFYKEGITGGCKLSPLSYCPTNSVTREQMAVFVLRAMYGPSYTPPPAVGIFADVPDNFFKPWIEAFYNEGITSGCKLSPLSYCPKNTVTREQMAVFILKAEYGPSYTPPTATGIFSDVPDNFFKPWIEAFYNEGITSGCKLSPLSYCPKNPVTRGQMAVFIDRAFDFTPIP